MADKFHITKNLDWRSLSTQHQSRGTCGQKTVLRGLTLPRALTEDVSFTSLRSTVDQGQ